MFKKTAIAAIAALTIAASMASPAQALSKKGAIALGAFSAVAIGIAAAHANDGYHDGYHGHRYNPRGAYKRAARQCAYRYGWRTWRWERCMDRRGF
ncbi:MAG: hypothetical protein WBD37_07605 [Anderseniella sp.]